MYINHHFSPNVTICFKQTTRVEYILYTVQQTLRNIMKEKYTKENYDRKEEGKAS